MSRHAAATRATAIIVGAMGVVSASAVAVAAKPDLPPIRMSASNQVPTCVTPDRLMAFLKTRNRNLIPRFERIAEWYRHHGEAWRVRWDYAFFQMALETNFLTYRRPNGKWGDVDPKQNNFAGLGTTGGGVPGDSYPDVSTGVLAQIQHLVAYSGERMKNPVGPRTRLKQDVIVKLSAPVAARRPVTFQDLSGRWAVDKRYGRSIAYVASVFEKRFCRGGFQAHRRSGTEAARADRARAPQVAASSTRAAGAGSSGAAQTAGCTVSIASFGGSRTVLIRAKKGQTVSLTALDVEPKDADDMVRGFIAQYAPGGAAIGTYDNRRAALSEAYRRCPDAARPTIR